MPRSAATCEELMFGAEQIGRAEREFGFRYPPAFLAAAPALEALAATPAFATAFPETRLVQPEDLAAAWAGRCPPALVPFMCTGRPGSGDHYCFHRCRSGTGLPVVVFADHAVVYDWPHYDAFLRWVAGRCATAQAEAGATPDPAGK
jgi:hypothetical protein